jgi:enoyl-CoA hydratase/carnithine racemase
MIQRVRYDLDGGIATITMDDGKRNALSPAMFAELDYGTHAASKARARGPVLRAIRSAIEADGAWLSV